MDKDHPTTSQKNNNDESTEEEIIEDISIAEEFTDSDDDIPIFLNDESDFGDKKRQLFDIDDEKFFLDDVDKFLSGDNIAKHFKPLENDPEEVKENIVPSNSNANPEKIQKTTKALGESSHYKELSPMNEDVILINDKKISLSALKKVQSGSSMPVEETRQFTSLNFPKVPAAVSLRTSHSLDLDLSLGNSDDSLNDSIEHENSIDEIIEHHEYRSEMSDTSESEDNKKITVQLEIPKIEEKEEVVVVKKMEKVTPDYLKEPLDDITEEESEAESKEHPVPVKSSIIERGSQFRAILEHTLLPARSFEKEDSDILQTLGHSHSLDLSNKTIKELQDIVIEKDSCLDALNLQLSALARRESLKDGTGRESLKESAPYSIATSASTEYRTINEDFNLKILDIENELHERASCIEQLKEKLHMTVQEREQFQLESEKLAQEVLELRTKVAGVESMRSSDEDRTVISASRINDFRRALPEDEAACFTKVWSKFENFHKNEIEQIKVGHEEEIKRLTQSLDNEKHQTEAEINRWRQLLENVKSTAPEIKELRHELELKHSKEMEELREYFEKRCVDMEKQYSEDVFSQHSKRLEDVDTDGSDNETLPDDDLPINDSPKKTAKESPVKRRSLMQTSALSTAIDEDIIFDVEEVKQVFNDKIKDINKKHEELVESLKTKLKRYEHSFSHGEELSALLSENSRDDSHWPPELILLREKLTAKSQLEIAQLKIKHEEEMARMKTEIELQLQRRLKRHAVFDGNRDLEKIISERDNLRELSASLRFTLCELAKYFSNCEDDLNNTVHEELIKGSENGQETEFNISVISSNTKRLVTFKPDISSLIAIVEDPKLLEFISKNSDDGGSLVQINIVDCLERLNSEANNILGLSEALCKRNKFDNSTDKLSEKADSCEEEDGLKRSHCKSLDFYEKAHSDDKTENAVQSLPMFLEEIEASELHEKLVELKNQLLKAEEEKQNLRSELTKIVKRSSSLEQELQEAKSQLESFSGPKETVTEGFGTKTPTDFADKSFSLIELQEKAKNFLTASANSSAVDNAVIVYNLIEDFCRETDRHMETEKRNQDDLHLQIEAADKQLKATRQFLEDQASEREQERDEFSKEIEKLRIIVKEKEKDKAAQDSLTKDIANLEEQIKEFNAQAAGFAEQKAKYEEDLKASIDKVFDLREIITDLELQIQTKTLNENVLSEKCKELESYLDQQSQSMKEELDSVRADVEEAGYAERIRYLEEQLKLVRPTAEQKLLSDQMTSQLKTIEMLLDRKTKTLEAFHALASACSTTCSSPSEDVSRGMDLDGSDSSPLRIPKMSTEGSFLPFEEVQRILEKLSKHNRVEEATVKKVTDLEMQVNGMRANYHEIQQEKDILQERMSEQLMKISSLQSRLDEQRIRAEELNKQSTSDLTLRNHDLQNELSSLRETLTARDKQIANLNQLLEHSKKIIDRQEHELAFSGDNDKSLVDRYEDELKKQSDEIQRLKTKIQTEMINKVALPDLMETMLAEKNDEIDSLREQLMSKESDDVTQQKIVEQIFAKTATSDNSSTPPASCVGGTILSMISEYDEPDPLRRMADSGAQFQPQPINAPSKHETFNFNDMTASTQSEFLTDKATADSSSKVDSPPQMPSNVHLVPRHLAFTSNDESSMMNDVNKLRKELEQITKEKNEAVESLRAELTAKADEMSNLQLDLAAKVKLYEDLTNEKKEVERELDDVRVSMMRFSAYETTLKKKDEELNNSLIKIKQLEMELKSQNQDLENLQISMSEKDVNIQKLSQELTVHQNKCKENERMLIDLERLKSQVTSYNDVMTEKENLLKKLEQDLMKYVKSENELLEKAEHCDKLLFVNQQLESDVDYLKRELSIKSYALEKCKIDLQDMEQKVDSLKKEDDVLVMEDNRNISVEEITAKLERELNYSAELDGNIIKAIESESEINSELEDLGGKRPSRYQEKMKKLEDEIESLKKQYQKISSELDEEKKNSDSIQMQDASLIEAIKIRLEAALDNENVLKKLLDAERHKTESLSTQLTGVQRTKSFDNYLLFNKSSVPDSPRRLAKLNEFESEVVSRLESEIKLLSSQNERERDRVVDLQKVLDRERDRFTKAIADQQEYSEQIKKEVKRLVNDKEQLESELDQLHDLKMKYFELEREKDKLMDTIRVLRNDIDRSSKRETKLADALLKESDGNDSVPEQFMQKLKEINKSLADNVRENHQMAETLHILTEERRSLQLKIAELENNGSVAHFQNYNNQDLEERANHLFAKYMRCESFRKALVYQKKFLLITIASTIGFGNVQLPLFKADSRKRKSFRSVILVVIAIERMKYIARRWTGKRMSAKIVFSAQPKRSQSATNNNWATFARMENNFQIMNTPPSRDRPENRNYPERPTTGFQLPSPSHFMKQAPLSRIFNVPEVEKKKSADILQRLFDS